MTMGLAGKIQIRLNEGRKTTVRQEAPRVKGEGGSSLASQREGTVDHLRYFIGC